MMAFSRLGASSNGWAFVAPWFLLITGVVNLVPVPQSDGWQLLLLAVGRPVGSAERHVEPMPEDPGS
jgi:membrane-associated protease RseP (regulator of RpoE activity)